jgi:hypothetical protein
LPVDSSLVWSLKVQPSIIITNNINGTYLLS